MAWCGAESPHAKQTGQAHLIRLALRLFLDPGRRGTEASRGARLHTVEISRQEETFVLESAGAARGVRLDPNHQLLLWEPEYGPRPALDSVKR